VSEATPAAPASPDNRLLLVHNADGGLLNALKDTWVRVVRPADDECALCRLTYGVRGMDRRWREFTRSLGLPVTFLHRDEFREQFATSPLRDVELPAALVEDRGALVQVVPAARMRASGDLDQLMDAVTDGLQRADKLG
jgi:hypothetical protein